jgi:hypothetical protein
MKFEHTEVFNFEGALRGMRNPLNSWAKSDSIFSIECEHEGMYHSDEVADAWADYRLKDTTFATEDQHDEEWVRVRDEAQAWLWDNGMAWVSGDHHYTANYIGPKDMDLCRRLINGGPEHRKFLRQIMVSVDITAPLYWWKEFDTYKVGTTANSTSTMHKLASTPITLDCFETDDITWFTDIDERLNPDTIITYCEALRQKYLETNDKRYWKELIRWLPNGWLQTRTVTMNYENLRSMAHQRMGHKLTEWHSFLEWVNTLPYAKELIFD